MSAALLDLHGFTLKTSQILIGHYLSYQPSQTLIEVLKQKGSSEASIKSLSSSPRRVIITGMGKHSSATGGPVLRSYVEKYLTAKQHNYSYDRSKGSFTTTLRPRSSLRGGGTRYIPPPSQSVAPPRHHPHQHSETTQTIQTTPPKPPSQPNLPNPPSLNVPSPSVNNFPPLKKSPSSDDIQRENNEINRAIRASRTSIHEYQQKTTEEESAFLSAVNLSLEQTILDQESEELHLAILQSIEEESSRSVANPHVGGEEDEEDVALQMALEESKNQIVAETVNTAEDDLELAIKASLIEGATSIDDDSDDAEAINIAIAESLNLSTKAENDDEDDEDLRKALKASMAGM